MFSIVFGYYNINALYTNMQYFQAVQKGRQRASKSQIKMFNAAGFGMLTLTTKKRADGVFEPVGEEEMAAVIESADGFVVIITDADGYTKAQSKVLTKQEAVKIYQKLTTDEKIPAYPGREIRIWSETRRTVQEE